MTRTVFTKNDIELEPGETHQQAYERLKLMTVSSEMLECTEKDFIAHLETPSKFVLWFNQNLVGPILDHENKLLSESGGTEIRILLGSKIYIDKIAEIIRFKSWESIYCPSPVVETA